MALPLSTSCSFICSIFQMTNHLKFVCMPKEEKSKAGYMTLSKKLLTVFLGTFNVMFIGIGSLFIKERGDISLGDVSLAWAAIVTVNIYMFGHISGAHINPALTFALAAVGQFPWKQVPAYVVAEMAGSTLASLLLGWFFHGIDPKLMLAVPVGPNPPHDLKVVVLEGMITFMYAMASCCTRADPRATKELAGVAMGAVVFVIAIIAGDITSACMNPARSIGPAIVTGDFQKAWLYITASLIGALAATSVHFFILMPEDHEFKQDVNQVKPTASISGEPMNLDSISLKEKSTELV